MAKFMRRVMRSSVQRWKRAELLLVALVPERLTWVTWDNALRKELSTGVVAMVDEQLGDDEKKVEFQPQVLINGLEDQHREKKCRTTAISGEICCRLVGRLSKKSRNCGIY
jgi:hypothetical protein